PWHTIRRHIKRIREHFERAGIGCEMVPADQNAKLRDDSNKLLTAVDAAALCQKSVRTWRTWDAAGFIPRPVRIGRSVFWRAGELDAWIEANCPARSE